MSNPRQGQLAGIVGNQAFAKGARSLVLPAGPGGTDILTGLTQGSWLITVIDNTDHTENEAAIMMLTGTSNIGRKHVIGVDGATLSISFNTFAKIALINNTAGAIDVQWSALQLI